MQDAQTRARQHLLLQGFTLYTDEAAVCMLLQGSTTLAASDHVWAIELSSDSWNHTDRLIGVVDSPFVQLLSSASETCRQENARGVLVCTQGVTLFVPLHPIDVRGSRMKIEEAIIRGHQPPTEKLDAYGDEAIAMEAKRRGLLVKKDDPEMDVKPGNQ